jgi:hypothetical protein
MKLYGAIDLHSTNNVTVVINSKIKWCIRSACPMICH